MTSVRKSHHIWWSREWCWHEECFEWALECGSEHHIVRRALFEAYLGSLEKQKKLLFTTKNVRCRLEFTQLHWDWIIHDSHRVISSGRLRSSDFSMMVIIGVAWGMENLNYKLIMWVKQPNVEVVHYSAWLYDFPWHGLHVHDRGENDTSYAP